MVKGFQGTVEAGLEAPQAKWGRAAQGKAGLAQTALPSSSVATENHCSNRKLLHIPNPRSDRDAMIAATAIEHGIAVVTRNTVDFAGTGVKLINPFVV